MMILSALLAWSGQRADSSASEDSRHDLAFKALARSWDEGIPLGDGLLGALVWQKGKALRLSLDRADLWDLRPVKEFDSPNFHFTWVRDQVLKKDYDPVHEMGDAPYDRDPAPTKIPAGALEFDIAKIGEVESVRLVLSDALCEVRWKNGARLTTFVHATEPVGWFRFEGLPQPLMPALIPPAYAGAAGADKDVVSGKTLAALGYSPPVISAGDRLARFHQAGWGGMSYDVAVEWRMPDPGALVGVWSVSSRYPRKARESAGQAARFITGAGEPAAADAARAASQALVRTFARDLDSHRRWWKAYWAKAGVELPDPILEKQWYLETYKLGAASRRGAPPITLQAVWTADNGSLPPWKGDFHNDLNTQLSYWPCYSGNHLEEGLAFLDWLWSIKPEAERYTKRYFGVEGLNVPGVCDLEGKPMGGWIQYSLGPTVSAWLAQHFYLHWRYSGDRTFLAERAYPWLKGVAVFLDGISVHGTGGKRRLPLSSSPEINDNRIDAWFPETTNFDLALIRWLYGAAAELAAELRLKDDEARWREILAEWPQLALAEDDGRLLVAPGYPLKESHRHFSHLMAIYPLGFVDRAGGEADRRTIRASLAELDRLGPDGWCGYSYAWLGCLAARAADGEKSVAALRTFAECFCLPNSFHANGDQSQTGKSKFTYRPFTLEGNFAFAAAVQEMLIQSHTGTVRLFPAVPAAWKDAAFDLLRTRGAFLVSARKRRGSVTDVRVVSEKGGLFRLENPFGVAGEIEAAGIPAGRVCRAGTVFEIDMKAGEAVILRAR
jgi:alpha-L-fucosidase 2